MDSGRLIEKAPLAPAGARPALGASAIWAFVRGQLEKHATFVRFTLAGMLGYVLYAGTVFLAYDGPVPFLPDKQTEADLLLFTSGDLRLLIATIIAAEVSITGGFFARDLWVFTDWPVVGRPRWLRFLQFQAKTLVSTFGIVTVTVNVLAGQADVPHYVGTPVGVALAFAWNWTWESAFIWRRSRQKPE